MSTLPTEMEMCQRCFDVFKYHNSAGVCMLCHRCDKFKRASEMWKDRGLIYSMEPN